MASLLFRWRERYLFRSAAKVYRVGHMPLWAALLLIVAAYFLGAYVEAWRTVKRVGKAYQDGKIAYVTTKPTS